MALNRWSMHLKSKTKLNTYILSFFVLMSTVIIIGDTIKYQNYKQTLIQNYKNKHINRTQQIRENYRLIFDKLQYYFEKAESANISKINQLLNIYKRESNKSHYF
jgi:predicted PurR-regulated permease PerM